MWPPAPLPVATTLSLLAAARVPRPRTGASPPRTCAASPNASARHPRRRLLRVHQDDRPDLLDVGRFPETRPGPRTFGADLVTIGTNQGAIPILLDRRVAPCAVEASSYSSNATSTRPGATGSRPITPPATPSRSCSCGDPLGTGWGDPGYWFRMSSGRQRCQTGRAFPTAAKLRRGTLAMANAGPDTNGSQFFLVCEGFPPPPRLHRLRPGHRPGLTVLDKIAAAGVDPSSEYYPRTARPANPVPHRDRAARRPLAPQPCTLSATYLRPYPGRYARPGRPARPYP